ncbi:hypothetical protein Tco_0095673 [Tanacetum coccineum]
MNDHDLYPTGDSIDRDFFSFAPGPYYATYPDDGVVASSYEVSREEWDSPHQPTLSILTKEVFKDPNVCKIVVDQFLTPGEMIRMEALTNDRLARKVSVLHCLMMSHGGELLARYRGLCNTPKIGSHRNGNIGVLRQSTKIKI